MEMNFVGEPGIDASKKFEPNIPAFASVTIGFHCLDEIIVPIRTYENLWMLPESKRERYKEIIELYAQENLERILKHHEIELDYTTVYCLSISFTADNVENLWNVHDWVLWESASDKTAPVILHRWVKPELASLIEIEKRPKVKHQHVDRAMKKNPRIVLRTSTVVVNGETKYLALCANHCRLYIVDRTRVSVTDNFFRAIENKDIHELVVGLKTKEPEDTRLAWAIGDTMAEATESCLDMADVIWKRVFAKTDSPMCTY